MSRKKIVDVVPCVLLCDGLWNVVDFCIRHLIECDKIKSRE
jgi:hypothetical protein